MRGLSRVGKGGACSRVESGAGLGCLEGTLLLLLLASAGQKACGLGRAEAGWGG